MKEDLLYIVAVERVLQIDDFGEVQTPFSALLLKLIYLNAVCNH